jgi:hypothetical protein
MLREGESASRGRPHPFLRAMGRTARWMTSPLRAMWESDRPLDAYGLVQMSSVAGDALLAIALADSVFFSVPVGEARTKVALYLALTMAPLAGAAPLLVPLLDRGSYRRLIAFVACFGRAGLAAYGASVLSSAVLFPVVFGALVLSRVFAITRTGLVAAYAGDERALVKANARLGRLGAIAALLAAVFGVPVLKIGGAGAVLYLAAATYGMAAALTVRLARPEQAAEDLAAARGREPSPPIRVRGGRLRSLGVPAFGTAALRGAQGFLLFLFAFALRAGQRPAWWLGVVLAAGIAGGFAGDVVAPLVRRRIPGGAVVLASLVTCCLAAAFAAVRPSLWTLALLSGIAGAATEVGRLAFQSLMQSRAPEGSEGRVYVRYEVVFQLAWVFGALIPATIPISLHGGTIVLGVSYGLLAVIYVVAVGRRASSARSPF